MTTSRSRCPNTDGSPVRGVVAGNHDIGEEPDALLLGQPIDARRIDRWDRLAGDHHWALDLESWRLVGVDGFLYGSGLPADAAQRARLTQTLTEWDGPVGLFVHKPLFIDHPDEDSDGHHSFTATNRAPLMELLDRVGVRFVASAHLHQARVTTRSEIRLVWTPSTAFPATEALPGADRSLGWVEHVLDGDEHLVELVAVAELESVPLVAFKHDGRYQYLYQTPPSPPDPADL
jgi:hypothetical protein